MSLEVFGLIKDLVPTNPTGTDPKSEGDDHLRGVKSTLQAQFPGFTTAIPVTVTADIINSRDALTLNGKTTGAAAGNIPVLGAGGLIEITDLPVTQTPVANLIPQLGSDGLIPPALLPIMPNITYMTPVAAPGGLIQGIPAAARRVVFNIYNGTAGGAASPGSFKCQVNNISQSTGYTNADASIISAFDLGLFGGDGTTQSFNYSLVVTLTKQNSAGNVWFMELSKLSILTTQAGGNSQAALFGTVALTGALTGLQLSTGLTSGTLSVGWE